MKSLFLSILAILQTLTVFAQTDEEVLQKLEYDWLIAEFKNDTAAIASLMDETFVAVGLTKTYSKQAELDGIFTTMNERIRAGHVVDSLYFDDVRITIYDNTAVVTFISVTKGTIKDVPFANRRTRMYDVWIRKNGVWKAVSSQVTPIR
ncbi:nuclear transport factor 2 family protein [Fibrisoma montanum]|uniref:Nuclear transport factor 2 family protein n=1 Tax=Fibrisoma montanum TaxID=2305895 RepID=A0A418MAF8_9BACT|nr:nuclear transport factor 2 family protein [Fibrisoma montanum]RIV23340.1 nuclear transport factor 2 family protein [Fibrisoma montanum]